MHKYLKHDPWLIVETNFDPKNQRSSESLFSIGNGRMGQRANFEEQYSGESLQGSYIGGVYYPDKTRVGWWKNGYPKYFAKVLNSPNWIGINIEIDGTTLDLAHCKIANFTRTLNMQAGYLERQFEAELDDGKKIAVHCQRFLSIVDDETGAIKYSITPLNFSANISITPYIDGNVCNEDANYDEIFWNRIDEATEPYSGTITVETKKTFFQVTAAMRFAIYQNQQELELTPEVITQEKYTANKVTVKCEVNQEITIYKYAAIVSSLNYDKNELQNRAKTILNDIYNKGFDAMLQQQTDAWAAIWEHSDVTVTGDIAAQQAVRFNIFQLYQTYSGKDPHLNIGPKGFTGEKYGGVTYWDTEAYCFPFYLSTAEPKVARNLLLYRYKHLAKAIENGEKLGFTNGAALYPMVTINGEECHNEWEITFEEIHRNGAIAYAIYNYIRYTDNKEYLIDYGLEVLIAISRFWSQRFNFSETKKQYVILGVTGPNEYENNVNNNWYTSCIARWTMRYTLETINYVKQTNTEKYAQLIKKINFAPEQEISEWQNIIENIYFPEDDKLGIFLQQEGYLDKEQILAANLDPKERPLNQHWSWDRILRSCFIKQADVLQGLYMLEDEYDDAIIKRNFDFYEPRTVHESSLSPCVHAILAAKLGYQEKSYELYLRTARLDLDDYNNEVAEGCHITSMAGSWMVITQGFGGMRVKNGQLHFNPFIIPNWESFSFKILFRDWLLKITINQQQINIANESPQEIVLRVFGKEYTIAGNNTQDIDWK